MSWNKLASSLFFPHPMSPPLSFCLGILLGPTQKVHQATAHRGALRQGRPQEVAHRAVAQVGIIGAEQIEDTSLGDHHARMHLLRVRFGLGGLGLLNCEFLDARSIAIDD